MVRTLSQMQCRRIAGLEAAVWIRTEDQRTTYRVLMSGNAHPPAPHGYAGVRAVARLTFAELFRDRVTGLATGSRIVCAEGVLDEVGLAPTRSRRSAATCSRWRGTRCPPRRSTRS